MGTDSATGRILLVLIALAAWTTAAHAETRWHAGLDLRAEIGTHPIRAGGGLGFGKKLDTTLVLDPMFWTDGQHDIDLFASWGIADGGYGPIAGWRTTAIGIVGGRQFQEKLLVGFGAKLPSLRGLDVRWHFELATVIAKHGADLPTDWISFASGRDFIDLVNFGMFLTVEFGRAI